MQIIQNIFITIKIFHRFIHRHPVNSWYNLKEIVERTLGNPSVSKVRFDDQVE